MNTATQEWIGGESVWEIRDHIGNLIDTMPHCEDRSELLRMIQNVGTIDPIEGFVGCHIHFTEEPIFLVRDGSGRNYCTKRNYTDFDADDRAYVDECDEDEAQENGLHAQTFGEWLDSAELGDEFDNADDMFTVIRVN